MKEHLQKRRDRWLKLRQATLDSINDTYGDHLDTEIEKYAQLKLAQSRQKDLDSKHEEWGKFKDIILYAILAILGGSVFAGSSRFLVGQFEVDDNFVLIASTFFGILMTLSSHFLASKFFAEKILYDQYKTKLEILTEEEKQSSQSLNNNFLQNQINTLKRTEKTIARSISISSYGLVVLAALIESGSVYLIFTLSSKPPNPLVMILAMTAPTFVLLVISHYTAANKKVPAKNEKLRMTYGQLENEIDELYS